VKKPNEDDERLSALLDGRVQGQQREELLAHLAANEDDYAVFTSTASALRALEEEDARAAAAKQEGVIPLRRPARGPALPLRWLALAASVATIALIGSLTVWSRGSWVGDPVRWAAHAAPQGLPEKWNRAPWSVRGSGNRPHDEDAVRAGAMLVQLASAAQAGDTASVYLLARQLAERYGRGTDADAPLRRIAARPGAPADSLAELIVQARDGLARLGRKPLEMGSWAEAARLAARNRNDEFFRDGDRINRVTRGMLRRATRLAGDDAAAHAAVKDVSAALSGDQPLRWEALEQSLTTLLTEIAS